MKHFTFLDKEEKANTITHAAGLLLMVLSAPLLINKMIEGGAWLITGGLSFCFGALFVFLSSTFYHLSIHESKKKLWRTIDHIAIFFLIGGTYTPFILKYYPTSDGMKFLALHWILILTGIIFKVFYTGKLEIVSTLMYVFLGWMVVFIYQPITSNMNDNVFMWLMIGGISYTIGVIFYIWEKLPYNHSIWHLFVLGGCFGHYAALYNF
ncbi:MAG: hemolysin III family protein [Saprospiraceae bacterium]|nr:hemolysin III family protein [Saprospiraceae bacterium]